MSAAAPARAAFSIPLDPRLLAVAGLGAAFLSGAMIARGPALGVAFVFLLLYVPLVLLNLPAALAIWTVITFVRYLPQVSVGPNAASILVLLGWAGTAVGRRSLGAVGAHRALPALIGLLLAWLSLSTLWAESTGAVWSTSWHWYTAALVVVVVAGTVRTLRHVELIMAGFVAGAVLSVVLGLVGLSTGSASGTVVEGRLTGGSGDPNYLAAGIVPALALAGGLLQVRHGALARLALAVAVAVLGVGLVATQSRGGLVAAAVALATAVVVARGRRAALLGFAATLIAAGGLWLIANPAAVERFTTADEGGSGRSELWSVAWEMGLDRPLNGVGLNNFQERAADYVFEVGGLRFVEIIAERPHVAHSAYLQAFAETGLIGLGLLIALYLVALRVARAADRAFVASRDGTGSALARALAVALSGMLAAAVFLSNGSDPRLWLLIGLSPALLALSRKTPA